MSGGVSVKTDPRAEDLIQLVSQVAMPRAADAGPRERHSAVLVFRGNGPHGGCERGGDALRIAKWGIAKLREWGGGGR